MHEVNRAQSLVPMVSAQERTLGSVPASGKRTPLGGRVYWAGALAVAVLLFSALAFPLWQAQARVNSLSVEKRHWQDVLVPAGETQETPLIPTMEELPALVEACREAFVAEGVLVKTLNVERFDSTNASGGKADAPTMDYALLRLHWSGTWSGIERALAGLAKDGRLGITVAEVHLSEGGGEGLLQLYFRSP